MGMIGRATRREKKFLNPVPTTVGDWRMMLGVAYLYITNKEERRPTRALGPFRTEVAVYERAPASGLRVTWMGHSSMLLEIDGVRVLVDPVWDERAGADKLGGTETIFPGSPAAGGAAAGGCGVDFTRSLRSSWGVDGTAAGEDGGGTRGAVGDLA